MRVVLAVGLAAALAGCGTDRSTREPCSPNRTQTAAAPARLPQRWAVIINGDTELRHKQNAVLAYRTVRSLGFTDDHVFVLTAADRRVTLPKTLQRFHAGQEELAAVFGKIAAASAKGDLVLIYGTGHGDLSEEGESYLELRGGELWALDLRDQIEQLPTDTVVVMDQCFSGGFANAFDGTTARAIVATTVDAQHSTECSHFARAFWRCFTKAGRADRNGDGKISVREAYQVALEAHQRALEGDPELGANGIYRAFNGLDDTLLQAPAVETARIQ
ncbi:MAG TPA: hypothetical protein VN428_20810 [Bryobacteraceae bacterium]|nr:hypothetical protein [Bryobacteraceae bacterium]